MKNNTRLTDEWGAFTAIPNNFIENAQGLSDAAFRLFVFLRRYTNSETGRAFPSYKFIQEKNGWTPKTIAKAIRELESAGWVEREKEIGAVTSYVLKRKDYFPEGSGVLPVGKRGTSRGEVGVLPVGKSIKNNTKKTKEKEISSSRSSGSKNPHYDCFAAAYRRHYEYPYVSKQADFVQYNKWKKADNGLTDDSQFEIAVRNYFDSPLKAHTFAHLVTQFATFRKSALDRFGKPSEERQKPLPPSSAAPPSPKGCDRCVQGWVMPGTPDNQTPYAKKCDCQKGA